MAWCALSLLVLGFANKVDVQGQVFVIDDDGPAHFSTIRDGIQVAGEGDILLVKEGNYPETQYPYMTIAGKSLTIQAEKGHTVTIGRGCTIRDLTAAQSVRLQGLRFVGLSIHDNAGTVWIEDCTTSSPSGVGVARSGSVVLIRTSATGRHGEECSWDDLPLPGLDIVDSVVHAFGCTFQGGNGDPRGTTNCTPTGGADGIVMRDPQSFLFLSKCTARGGHGTCTLYDNTFIISVPGGAGLRANGPAEVFDSSLVRGPSWYNFWSDCTAAAGVDQAGPVTLHGGRALRFDSNGPVREGELITYSFEGPPHVAVWLASGLKATSQFELSPFGTALVGQPQQVDFAGITGDDGRLEFSIPMPTFVVPGYEGRSTVAQAFYLDPHPAGPLGGSGKIRHVPLRFVRGEGSMLVGLDESF